MSQAAKRQRLESVYTRVLPELLLSYDFIANDLVSCSEVCKEWNDIIKTQFSKWYDQLLSRENLSDPSFDMNLVGYKRMQIYELYKRKWLDRTCFDRIRNLLSPYHNHRDRMGFVALNHRGKVDSQFLIRHCASAELIFELHRKNQICGEFNRFELMTGKREPVPRNWLEYFRYFVKLRESTSMKFVIRIDTTWPNFKMDIIEIDGAKTYIELRLFGTPVLLQTRIWPDLVAVLIRIEEYRTHFRKTYWKGLSEITLERLFEGTEHLLPEKREEWARSKKLARVFDKLRNQTQIVKN